MPENIDQKAFYEMIMLVALATCYKPKEDFLTDDQIIGRRYAPIEAYGKSCISRMIDCGAVEFKFVEPIFPDSRGDKVLYIRRPGLADEDIEDFIYSKTQHLRELLAKSLEYQFHLKALSNELTCCECIEYCNFYAERAGLTLANCNHNNAKLRLLILETTVEKVFMLLWRAIKTKSKETSSSETVADFSVVVDMAFDLFIHYKKLNIEIEEYSRPRSLKTSVLSGIVELLRGVNNVLS